MYEASICTHLLIQYNFLANHSQPLHLFFKKLYLKKTQISCASYEETDIMTSSISAESEDVAAILTLQSLDSKISTFERGEVGLSLYSLTSG